MPHEIDPATDTKREGLLDGLWGCLTVAFSLAVAVFWVALCVKIAWTVVCWVF